jgi:hypothetical protein
VPTNWRSLIEDQSTMATLLQAYNSSPPPRSAQAMECLSQLASVRRFPHTCLPSSHHSSAATPLNPTPTLMSHKSYQ